MSKPVLIIKNATLEGPGIIGEVLHENGVSMDIRDLDAGDSFPSPQDYRAMIVMGGPNSANDATVKMQNEIQNIRSALSAKIPYFGVCLGLQTLVKAAGGSVRKNEIKEVGCSDNVGHPFTVELTEQGKEDPLMKDVDDPLPMFHLHGETVELTPRMTLLGVGKWCRNQVVRVTNNAYGIQGHLELTPEMLHELYANDIDLSKINQNHLLEEWEAFRKRYEDNCRLLIRNFLSIVGLRNIAK
jgi:GMP synthase (glutamine-hydrolysing)